MEIVQISNIREIKKAKEELEKKLDIKITLSRKTATIEGNSLEEYEVANILNAISLGFSAKKSIHLLGEEISFKKINIKDFTKRKDMYEVRARIIGKEGKIKRTLEDLSDCEIIIRENTIGILGSAEEMEKTITGITNLIRGSKVSNVYNYLEKLNREKKKLNKS
ncbi:MAG: hypothetical protein Q8L29_02885 [archaeon]|nr:hypothetical protein [archaeon]